MTTMMMMTDPYLLSFEHSYFKFWQSSKNKQLYCSATLIIKSAIYCKFNIFNIFCLLTYSRRICKDCDTAFHKLSLFWLNIFIDFTQYSRPVYICPNIVIEGVRPHDCSNAHLNEVESAERTLLSSSRSEVNRLILFWMTEPLTEANWKKKILFWMISEFQRACRSPETPGPYMFLSFSLCLYFFLSFLLSPFSSFQPFQASLDPSTKDPSQVSSRNRWIAVTRSAKRASRWKRRQRWWKAGKDVISSVTSIGQLLTLSASNGCGHAFDAICPFLGTPCGHIAFSRAL